MTETINITPSSRGYVVALFAILENGTYGSKQWAREEIHKAFDAVAVMNPESWGPLPKSPDLLLECAAIITERARAIVQGLIDSETEAGHADLLNRSELYNDALAGERHLDIAGKHLREYVERYRREV